MTEVKLEITLKPNIQTKATPAPMIENSRKGKLNIKFLSFAMLNGELVKPRNDVF